jgi:hypothetical protein
MWSDSDGGRGPEGIESSVKSYTERIYAILINLLLDLTDVVDKIKRKT